MLHAWMPFAPSFYLRDSAYNCFQQKNKRAVTMAMDHVLSTLKYITPAAYNLPRQPSWMSGSCSWGTSTSVELCAACWPSCDWLTMPRGHNFFSLGRSFLEMQLRSARSITGPSSWSAKRCWSLQSSYPWAAETPQKKHSSAGFWKSDSHPILFDSCHMLAM